MAPRPSTEPDCSAQISSIRSLYLRGDFYELLARQAAAASM